MSEVKNKGAALANSLDCQTSKKVLLPRLLLGGKKSYSRYEF